MMSLERWSFLMSMSGAAAEKEPSTPRRDERELVLKLVSECWRRGNLDAAEEILARDYRFHEAGRTATREGWMDAVRAMRANAPRCIATCSARSWRPGRS